MPDPWEKRETESAQAFEAFAVYRDQGVQRSLTKTAQDLNKSRMMLGDWSTQHDWVRRALAWDAHLDAQARAVIEQERIDMLKRHSQLGAAMFARVVQRIAGDTEGGVKAIDANSLSAQDVVAIAREAVKIERMSRGLPAETVAQSISQTITAPFDEERQHALNILSDPIARKLAEQVLARLAAKSPTPETNGHSNGKDVSRET